MADERKQIPPFGLRLPDGMRDRIAIEAKRNNRSMNAEITARLEASLSGAPSYSAEQVAELIEAVEARCSKRAEPQLRLRASLGSGGFSGQQVSDMLAQIQAALRGAVNSAEPH